MSVLPIRKYPDPVLRRAAAPVPKITKEVKKLLRDMMDTMREAGGVGLAGPQVGISKRIIVVDVSDEKDPDPKKKRPFPKPFGLVNPEIVFEEGGLDSEEGCLSFPSDVRGVVPRSARVTVKAVNPETGKTVQIKADTLLSRVLQHEIDHLNGVLFIDRMAFSHKMKLRHALAALEQENKWSLA